MDPIADLPAFLRRRVRAVMREPELAYGVKEMMPRASEFGDPQSALMAGLAMVPEARSFIEDGYDESWGDVRLPKYVPEVIIGSGIHAAVYAAVRRRLGFPAPLVLERGKVAGGSFAVSRAPSFFLNSRNRPGTLSVPGDSQGSLNFIPGSCVQPAHLGGSEYQTNDALAWAIRSTLAMNARVATGRDVLSVGVRIDKAGLLGPVNRPAIFLGRRAPLRTDRLIIADGLGAPIDPTAGLGKRFDRVLTFDQFMGRMDMMFPFKGVDRVAVIGAGDSARTVIESLAGQGPATGMSVAALDYPRLIDWYGCPQRTPEEWLQCNRPRYWGIASLLNRRVAPKPRATSFAVGYDCVFVDGVPYDYAVVAAGFIPRTPSDDVLETGLAEKVKYVKSGTVEIAQQFGAAQIYRVGPAAELPYAPAERALIERVQENSTSIFRYAGKTAALARMVG